MSAAFWNLIERGGVIMWPLLGLSLIAVTLSIERLWFFVRTNHPGRRARLTQMTGLLLRGEFASVRTLADSDRSVYGAMRRRLLDSTPPSEVAAAAAVESQRRRLERYSATLSTIITAAPMLGILGTVLGIISSFEVLADQTSADPRSVSRGIAEALITTAAGLIISLCTLFPYNGFRAQIDRTLSRMETLAAAAVGSDRSDRDGS